MSKSESQSLVMYICVGHSRYADTFIKHRIDFWLLKIIFSLYEINVLKKNNVQVCYRRHSKEL